MPQHWTKPSPATLELFASVKPEHPLVETGRLFGLPKYFVQGHMIGGVFGDDLNIRLSEPDRAELTTLGAKAFEPMGRSPLREYLLVPRSMHGDAELVRRWYERATAYALTLPEKEAQKKGVVRRAIASVAGKVSAAAGVVAETVARVVKPSKKKEKAEKRERRAEPAVDPTRLANAPVRKRPAVVKAINAKTAKELVRVVDAQARATKSKVGKAGKPVTAGTSKAARTGKPAQKPAGSKVEAKAKAKATKATGPAGARTGKPAATKGQGPTAASKKSASKAPKGAAKATKPAPAKAKPGRANAKKSAPKSAAAKARKPAAKGR